jgi:D-glycero-D-manno-heptose 1,7-bisphosphate phosphatase
VNIVILDRDGVINADSDAFVKSPADWLPLPGALDAIARLYHAGWRVYVATNQSGIARGLFDEATVEAIHAKMRGALNTLGAHFDGIMVCPHGPGDGCACRKPQPGMYLEIAGRSGLPLDGAPIIGDSYRDLAAARAVGARPILVRTGKGEHTLAEHPELADGEVYDNLAAAVDALLQSP